MIYYYLSYYNKNVSINKYIKILKNNSIQHYHENSRKIKMYIIENKLSNYFILDLKTFKNTLKNKSSSNMNKHTIISAIKIILSKMLSIFIKKIWMSMI